ncbi:MAG: alpha/beta hydrolase [Acidobacteriaceae bacterium]|nr:alpha/beta hydrolase [Acidobacteriaceae bacterium]
MIEGFVDIEGIKTFYQQVGDGPDLVLVHGWSFDHACWSGQLSTLSGHSRVTVYDLPGCGKSGAPHSGFPFDLYIEHLYGFLQSLQIKSAVFAGHSMGGSIVLQYVVTFPSTVNSFVIVDSELPNAAEAIAVKAAETAIHKLGLERTTPYFQNLFYGINFQAANPQAMAEWRRQFLANSTDNLLSALSAWVNRQDVSPLLSKVACPSILLVGMEDLFASLAHAQALREAIPLAQLLPIGNAGHLTPQEQPTSVNAALDQALAFVDSRS